MQSTYIGGDGKEIGILRRWQCGCDNGAGKVRARGQFHQTSMSKARAMWQWRHHKGDEGDGNRPGIAHVDDQHRWGEGCAMIAEQRYNKIDKSGLGGLILYGLPPCWNFPKPSVGNNPKDLQMRYSRFDWVPLWWWRLYKPAAANNVVWQKKMPPW